MSVSHSITISNSLEVWEQFFIKIVVDSGRYEILGELGRGAWGIVYKARHKELNKVVALKKLRDIEKPDSPQVERFKREARLLANLEHPNIVKVFDAGVFEDGSRYITMEFIKGATLSTLIKTQKFGCQEATDLVVKIAKAISYAHSKGIIHRDIKPPNIIIREDGLPIITDFGVAKEVNAQTCATESGELLGTPAYMPPEQISGSVKEIDERSDIYSLGAVLYELLTSKPPFEGYNFFDLSTKILNDEPESPTKLNHAIPKDIETICLKALNKDKKLRYQSMNEMIEDLERFTRGEDIFAKPPSLLKKAKKVILKHNNIIILAFLILGIALAFIYSPSQQIIMSSDMIFIPESTFKMTDTATGRLKDVYVKSFFIDKYEVTNLQYKEFVDATKYPSPKHWKNGEIPKGKEYFPVVNVTYKDALAYSKWTGKRLPTSEEWEKAARGVDGREYVWGNEDYQNGFCNAESSAPSPVGKFSKDKSHYSCYDMAGNVSELVADGVPRGSNFSIKGIFCKTYSCYPLSGEDWYADTVGFRCAKDITK